MPSLQKSTGKYLSHNFTLLSCKQHMDSHTTLIIILAEVSNNRRRKGFRDSHDKNNHLYIAKELGHILIKETSDTS